MTNTVNLNEMTSKELKAMAKELGVKDWWTLKKADLIAEITFAIADKEEAGEDVDVENIAENAQNEPEDAPETSDDKNIAEPKKRKKEDLITYKGETKNLSQWAKELGMPGQTLFARIHLSNWPVEKAFETPVKKRAKKEEEKNPASKYIDEYVKELTEKVTETEVEA